MELLELIGLLDTKSRIFVVVVLILVLDRIGFFGKAYSAIGKIYNDRIKFSKENLDLKEAEIDMVAQQEATASAATFARENRMFGLLESVVKDDLTTISNTLQQMMERDVEQTKVLIELKDSSDLLGNRIIYLSDCIRELSGAILLKHDDIDISG